MLDSDEPALPGQVPQAGHPLVAHFYRAVVSHADVWRQRMDATTNWAAATTAGMLTFSFGASGAPHVVLLLSLAFDVVFLLMESRRYQVYDLWRRRFRTLNRYLIVPVLVQGDASATHHSTEEIRRGLASVAEDLGRTVPHLHITEAVGYRIRRNYGYIFMIVLLAWGLKLEVHPAPAQSVGELVSRAAVGTLAGHWVVGLIVIFLVTCLVLAVRAPGERMIRWAEVPSPFSRFVPRALWAEAGSPGRTDGAPTRDGT